MLQDIDLRELAEVHGNGRDVVSAYFSGSDGLSKLSHRERKLRELLEDEPLEAENFERSMEMIRDLLDDHSVKGAEAVCFFSSAILDFARGYPVAVEIPNQLYVGPAPYIRPLAELQDEYETFALVACDNTRTRIFTVTNEVAEVEEAVRGGIKNHVRKGGWSQQRYERRRDEQLARYAEDIADALKDLVAQHGIERIVLLGSTETMQAIEDHLDDHIRECLCGSEPFDLDRSLDEMVTEAYLSYFDDERASEKDLWQKIKAEMMRGGAAVTGPQDVIENAQIGRVEAVAVIRDAKISGFKCRECEHVQAEGKQSCGACGSEDIFPVDLVDATARHLELTSADIDFVDPIRGLEKAGNIAALLRY